MSATTSRKEAPGEDARLRLQERDWKILDATFSIDTRALAVVRVLVAGLIIFQSLFIELGATHDPEVFTDFFTEYAHLLVIPPATMMLFGYRTRFAVIAAWLVYSLPLRAQLLAEIQVPLGYYILNISLFWFIFLPLDRHLAIDSRRLQSTPVRFLSVAGGALLFQIFLVYFSAGMIKDLGEWVIDATAMQTILAHPNYETALGVAILDYPVVTAVMSVATYVVEVVGALLVLVPGKTLTLRRMVMVPVFIAFHIGIAAFMGLGLFPYVMIALWLVFLPSVGWDGVWSRLGSRQRIAADAERDTSRWRNGIAGFAVTLAAISNVITWISYPEYDGVFGVFQDTMIWLVLYQQWLMFSLPSSIPG